MKNLLRKLNVFARLNQIEESLEAHNEILVYLIYGKATEKPKRKYVKSGKYSKKNK